MSPNKSFLSRFFLVFGHSDTEVSGIVSEDRGKGQNRKCCGERKLSQHLIVIMLSKCLKCCVGTAESPKGRGQPVCTGSSSNLEGVSAELANRRSGDVWVRDKSQGWK